MDEKQVFIESLGIGLSSYSNLYSLDLDNNEYLVVGQRANQDINLDTKNIKYNFIVNNQGIGINATRNEIMQPGQSGLYISDDITCKGRIITNSIEIQGVSISGEIDNAGIFHIINALSSNNIFYEGYSNINIPNKRYDNKYTPSYITIGSYTDTYSNLHPLNIVHSGNNSIENNHISIGNDINTDDPNPNNIESCKFTMGIIGNAQTSPAVITTTFNMPLEFHVSKTSSDINQLYLSDTGIPDYTNNSPPAMIIQPNNIVGINTSSIESFTYNVYGTQNLTNSPSLDVEGMAYINTICIYDNNLKKKRSLDDIFMRKDGLTIRADQIIGGTFKDGPYTFASDLYVGTQEKPYKLIIYNQAEICGNLNVSKLTVLHGNLITCGIVSFSNIVEFYKPVYFKNDIGVDNNLSINVGGNLFVDGIRVNANVDSSIAGINTISYATDNFNISGTSNMVIGGRLGVGVNRREPYINQLTINKHDSPYFELLLQDIQVNSPDISKVYMGHMQQSKIDNSFIIFTQKTIKQHNMYFYAGKCLNAFTMPDLIPTLAIMQNDRVGINTKTPQKTLDVSGDILGNNYYIRDSLNHVVKTKSLIDNNNNIMMPNIKSFNININDITAYNNPKMLNILGGINSYNGYYMNDKQICPIFYNSSSSAILNTNLGLGVTEPVSVPLQIRNTNLNANNNSILRFYRGKTSGNFQALYSGIDICDYDSQTQTYNRNNFKWYIYKYHIDNFKNNQIGPLQIGYTYNTYNPTKSAINVYYDQKKSYHIDINKPNIDYNYNKNAAMSIYGDLEVFGNINIIGNNNYYKNGNISIGPFSAISSALQSEQVNIPQFNSPSVNDISLIGKDLILLSKNSTNIGFYDNNIINSISATKTDKIPLYIYQNNSQYSAFKIITYNSYHDNLPDISKFEIELANLESTPHTINYNTVELSLKGYHVENMSMFEMTPRNSSVSGNSFISFAINGISGALYTHIGSSQNSYNHLTGKLIYDDVCLHIDDTSKYLLKLTNSSLVPAINFHKKGYNNNNWILNGPDILDNSFNIQYESTNANNNLISSNQLLKISPEGFYYFNSNISQNLTTNNTININSVYNKSSILLTNNYNSHQLNNNESVIPIVNSNLTYKAYSLFNNDNNNIILNNYFDYYIPTSKLPSQPRNDLSLVDYYISNSNFVLTNIYPAITTYYQSNIVVNYNYTSKFDNDQSTRQITNITKKINLLPKIKSQNANYLYEINDNSRKSITGKILKTSDNQFNYLNTYVIPVNNSIEIDENINNSYIFSDISSNIYYTSINTLYYTKAQTESIYLTSKIIVDDYYHFIDGTKTNVFYTCNTINYNQYNDINIDLLNITATNNIIINNYINTPKLIVKPNCTTNINGSSINFQYPLIYNRETITNGYNYFNNSGNNSIIINNSSSFINNTLDNVNQRYLNNIKTNYPIYTSNYEYLLEFDINDSSEKIIVVGNIQLNTSNDIYDFGINENYNYINFPIYYNNYQPHITLRNYIDTDNYQINNTHKIFSYNGNLEFYVDNTKLLSIDNSGNTNISGDINAKNLTVTGDILDKYGNLIIPELNSDIYSINCGEAYHVNSSNINFINSRGFSINRNNENSVNTNLFEINGGNNGDANFITLNSLTNGSLIHFTSLYNTNTKISIYRTGIFENTFGIWMMKNNDLILSNYIDGTPNSFNNYYNALSITYNNRNTNFDFKINGNINIDSSIKFIDTVNNNIDIIKISANTHYGVEIFNNMYAHKDIKVDGNLLTSSDKRFKNDITNIDNALNKLIKLNGVIYTNCLTNEKNSGLIAQEVLEVLPEVVKNDSNDYLTIAYGNMMGLVIEAIKELKQEIDYIKSKI